MGNHQSSIKSIDSSYGTPAYTHENEDIREGFATNVIPADQVCPSGNSGFPVLVQPFSKTPSNTTTTPYSGEKLTIQFPGIGRLYKLHRDTLCVDDIGTGHSFIYEGNQYNVTDICIRKPVHQNLSEVAPMGEFQIWGMPVTGGTSANYVVLILPLYGAGINYAPKKHENAFLNILRGKETVLQDVFHNSDYYTYSTCLEIQEGSAYGRKLVSVAYWETPIKLPFQNNTSEFSAFINGVSAKTFRTYYPLLQFTLNADGSKQNPVFSTQATKGFYSTYTTNPAIGETEFKTRFTKITGFTIIPQKRTDTVNYAKNYKCIPLNPSKDIKTDKNGEKRILIDPKTGERLDKELEAADEALRGIPETPSVSAGDITKWIVIVVGTVLGLIFIGYGIKFLVGFMKKAPEEVVEVVARNTKNVVANAINTAANTAKNVATNTAQGIVTTSTINNDYVFYGITSGIILVGILFTILYTVNIQTESEKLKQEERKYRYA
jgi:hypothetical protein